MKTNFISHSKMILGNERGGMAALLSVIVLSLIMVSTLSSFYIYVENRAKFQERIRVNYQMGYVMEDMSRAVVEARERLANGSCPAGNEIYIDCTVVCGTQTRAVGATPGLPGTVTADVPNFAVCVRNDSLNRIVNGADYFCAYNTDPGDATASPLVPPTYCAGLAKNDSQESGATMYASAPPTKSKVKNWYARLDKFFDTTIVKNAPRVSNSMQYALTAQIKAPTVLGWLIPERAVAQTGNPGGSHPTGVDCGSNAFCKAGSAETTLNIIGDAATGCLGSTDARCKRCTGTERNSDNCIKFSVCPPWLDARECVGNESTSDRRIHQVVLMEDPPVWNPPGSPASMCWGGVTPPAGSRNGPPGYTAANAARCAVPTIACTNFGQIMMTSCQEVNTTTGVALGMVNGYAVRCIDATAGATGYAGCVGIPNLTPPACGPTSTRVCYGAEASPQGDPSCCSGASICGAVSGSTATCVNGGPGGGFGGGCQTYFCNQATGMCHWMDCP